MNISLINNDAVSGIMKIAVEKNDYEAQVETRLRQLRQKAQMAGFRKGMVPLGMIRKLYGREMKAEEVNKCVSENLERYIRENSLRILGAPLPSETEQKPVDIDAQDEFEFCFDIALAPELDIKLTRRDRLNYYIINVDDAMLQRQIDAYCRDFGSYDPAEDIEETDLIKGVLSELDENREPREDGILVMDAVLIPMYLKDESERARFIGAKLNDVIIFNPGKACAGVAAEIASLLKTDSEHAAEIKSDFRFEVQEITRYRAAEVNQELFDKVFGPDAVKSEEEFREKVKLLMDGQLAPNSEHKFQIDMRTLLIKKVKDLAFADDILKRWLRSTDKAATPEKVEEDFPKAIADLKFNLAKDQLLRANGLDVDRNDLMNIARQMVWTQIAQLGIPSVNADMVDRYASEMLTKQDTVENIAAQALQNKLSEWIKTQVKVETKEVSYDEFAKLLA
ncbi:MAG: trigger factor family protein [Tannerella sp.]|jgi:trigger factor|nr:trigger factor family protein [Tannerella sp.]